MLRKALRCVTPLHPLFTPFIPLTPLHPSELYADKARFQLSAMDDAAEAFVRTPQPPKAKREHSETNVVTHLMVGGRRVQHPPGPDSTHK